MRTYEIYKVKNGKKPNWTHELVSTCVIASQKEALESLERFIASNPRTHFFIKEIGREEEE